MGVQRLAIKIELNYRLGSTSRSCSYCNHFHEVGSSGMEFRCEVIGLERGRLYRVNPKSICDRYDNSAYLQRFGLVVKDGKVVSW